MMYAQISPKGMGIAPSFTGRCCFILRPLDNKSGRQKPGTQWATLQRLIPVAVKAVGGI